VAPLVSRLAPNAPSPSFEATGGVFSSPPSPSSPADSSPQYRYLRRRADFHDPPTALPHPQPPRSPLFSFARFCLALSFSTCIDVLFGFPITENDSDPFFRPPHDTLFLSIILQCYVSNSGGNTLPPPEVFVWEDKAVPKNRTMTFVSSFCHTISPALRYEFIIYKQFSP